MPLHIWNSKSFQKWYEALKSAGNRLDDAKLLWQFEVKGKFLFCHVLWAKIWVASEGRHKENEFVFTRTDISTIVPIWRNPASPLDSKIVLVKEYRVPARTTDGFVHELPGGSSFKEGENPLEVAAHELEEEIGIQVSPDRLIRLTGRQLASTLSSHRAELFYVELTDEEIARVEAEAARKTTYGVVEDSERTYVEVAFISDLLKQQDVDWSMMGMIFQGLTSYKDYNRRNAD